MKGAVLVVVVLCCQLARAESSGGAFSSSVAPPPLTADRGFREGIRGPAAPPLSGESSEELLALKQFEQGLSAQAGDAASTQQVPWLTGLRRPDLPVVWDPRVVRYLLFYRDDPAGRKIMTAWLRRYGRYDAMVRRIAQKLHVPQALAYVAMIESGYDTDRVSYAGAGGIWQFMPATGNGYGLKRDYWIDERRDPERATQAALLHFKDLYTRFGTWELALAAYNAGHGAIMAAMRKYNTNDFWRLSRYEAGLPWQTVLYVPKILAAAIVGWNRQAFGFAQVESDPPWQFELVSVPTSMALSQIAQMANTTVDALESLNPEFRRGRTPPQGRNWVRVPIGSQAEFNRRVAAQRGSLDAYESYAWRLGDTVDMVAQRLGTTAAKLRRMNGWRSVTELRPGVVILIPPKSERSVAVASDITRDKIIVALPADAPKSIAGKKRVFYRVAPGDTLGEVAQQLQLYAADLARYNGLDPSATLLSNMVLQAFVSPKLDLAKVNVLDESALQLVETGSEAFLSDHEVAKGRARLTYQVRAGDTLQRIGRRFGLSIGDMARINQMSASTPLQVGQTIVVYVPAAKAKRLQAEQGKKRPRDQPIVQQDEVDPDTVDQEKSKKDAVAQTSDADEIEKAARQPSAANDDSDVPASPPPDNTENQDIVVHPM